MPARTAARRPAAGRPRASWTLTGEVMHMVRRLAKPIPVVELDKRLAPVEKWLTGMEKDVRRRVGRMTAAPARPRAVATPAAPRRTAPRRTRRRSAPAA